MITDSRDGDFAADAETASVSSRQLSKRERALRCSRGDKYPLAALSISPVPGMTDDPRRDSYRGQIFYVSSAISVARYLSRVCIIVVYYLALGTFNLHHFLPRRTMPSSTRRRSPGRIMPRNFRPLKFQLTMDESCPRASPRLPLPNPACHPRTFAYVPASFVTGIVERTSTGGEEVGRR